MFFQLQWEWGKLMVLIAFENRSICYPTLLISKDTGPDSHRLGHIKCYFNTI